MCHCIFWHAHTREERAQAKHRLDEARRLGDEVGIIIALASLTGRCATRKRRSS